MKIALAVLFGVLAGWFGSRVVNPPKVRAGDLIFVRQTREGTNSTVGDQVVGFACTASACYIASR